MAIEIDSNKPLPVSKGKAKKKAATDKLFKAWAAEYTRLYIAKPSGYHINENTGHIVAVVNGRRLAGVSAQRMKEMTRNMKQRSRE